MPPTSAPSELTRRRWLARASALSAISAALLAGCAAPPPEAPPPPSAPEALDRLRFVDTPEGARAIMPDAILFAFGKSELAAAADPVLDLLKPAFDKARGGILVEGFTDSVGGEAFNRKLSQDRANEVRNAIIARHVPPHRVQARGLGSTRNLPELNDGDRARNRRAEILFPGETVDSLGGSRIEELARALARDQQRERDGTAKP